MPAYSTTSVNVNGNTGAIVINVSDSLGGGDPVTYTFDIVVSCQNPGYTFTGGSPAATSTFGNNGARWDDKTYTTGAIPTSVTYNWSRTVSTATDYVVILMGTDGTLNTQWGTIPGGLIQNLPVMSASWPDSLQQEDDQFIIQPKEKQRPKRPLPPRPEKRTKKASRADRHR